MRTQMIKLIHPDRAVVATAQVLEEGAQYRGRIDLGLMPAPLKQTFADFEEIVNGQMFSLLDEIEEQIGAMGLKIRFSSGYEAKTADLQIYPSTNRISFQLAKEASQNPRTKALAA